MADALPGSTRRRNTPLAPSANDTRLNKNMHEVERDVYDRFDSGDEDRDMAEVRRLSEREKKERLRELNRGRDRSRSYEPEEVRIGVESRRRPATEEWDRNKGVRTNLASGKQHTIKTVGIGDVKAAAMDRESVRLLHSGKPIDIVCVDGSASATKALSHAFKRLPRNHTFILLHGSTSGLSRAEDMEAASIERKYMDMCDLNGRRCKFINFNYSNNRDFGEKVCQYEKYSNVESIVMGKRGYVSDFRRALLGSSTQSVMAACSMPVTIVREKEKHQLQ